MNRTVKPSNAKPTRRKRVDYAQYPALAASLRRGDRIKLWLINNAGLLSVAASWVCLLSILFTRPEGVEEMIRAFMASMFTAGFGLAWILRGK